MFQQLENALGVDPNMASALEGMVSGGGMPDLSSLGQLSQGSYSDPSTSATDPYQQQSQAQNPSQASNYAPQSYGQNPGQAGGQAGQAQSSSSSQSSCPSQSYSGGSGGGQRKALLIGCNYIGLPGQLSGCINDVNIMKKFLIQEGFSESNMKVLVDDPSYGTPIPNQQNMLAAFQWLSSNNSPGDCLFLHYSGHGGQMPSTHGNINDDTLVPVDYQTAGQIRDNTVYENIVKPLPQGVHLTAILDCCHSGTAMDLPYVFQANADNMASVFPNGQLEWQAIPQLLKSQKWDFKNRAHLKQQVFDMGKQVFMQGVLHQHSQGGASSAGGAGGSGSEYVQDTQNAVAADVIMLSGCKNEQTSADVGNVQSFHLPVGMSPGGAGGACTNSMISALEQNPDLTIIELLEQMRQQLVQLGFQQVPQLSTSRPLPLTEKFKEQLLKTAS